MVSIFPWIIFITGRLTAKMKISKKIKTPLLVLIPLLLVVTVIYLVMTYKAEKYIEEKQTQYSYTHQGSAAYEVPLIPNILYEEKSLTENNIYITEFVDYIASTFSYQFTGDKEAELDCRYDVVALVQGYTGDKDTYKSIWQKSFTLIPETSVRAQDKKISINKNVSCPINIYRTFAQQVNEESKLNTSTNLIIQMNLKLKVDTEYGSVEEIIAPNLTVPLDSRYFTISKGNIDEKTGKIEENIQVKLPLDKKVVFLCYIILSLLFATFIVLVFFASEPTKEDLYKKRLSKIFKKHGSRLVALNQTIDEIIEKQCKVWSMEDLIKICDDLVKPVFYKYSEESTEISHFYVFDRTCVYVYDFAESNPDLKKEETDDASTTSVLFPYQKVL